eukprot:1072430-Lingulodinium_polyedra.AAC.1
MDYYKPLTEARLGLTRLCKHFLTRNGCRNSENCNYARSLRDLRAVPSGMDFRGDMWEDGL